MSTIVVIGSINMDLVVKTRRLPHAGETLEGETFAAIPGGKGANQAVAACRMGAVVKMVGAVGDDSFGIALKSSLAQAGVDVRSVTQKEGISTGTATIIVDHSGDNRIIIVPGANGRVDQADIDRVEALIAGASMILLQFEIPQATIEQVADLAKKYAIPLMLNPAPVHPISAALMSKIDYLIVNEHEAEQLSGLVVRDIESGYRAAEVLRSKGAKKVVVTLGPQGALLLGDEMRLHAAARGVKVVDTTAAGDTFVGALAVGCVEGQPLQSALELAVNAGTLAVTRFGAQPSIPTREEVTAFLAQGNPKSSVKGVSRT